MIITHTTNASGQRRVYLGGKASLECWIEPLQDGRAWQLHVEYAPGAQPLDAPDTRAWVIYLLLALAQELRIPPDNLKTVPFETIAALHTANPLEYRRIAMPRRQVMDHGFMATAPNITRPRADFTSQDFHDAQRRRN